MTSNEFIKGHFTSQEVVKKVLQTNPKLVVLEFMVPWSELYKFMMPAVNEIAKKYKNHADFYTLDVDKLKDYARNQNVEVLPTFVLFRNNEEVKRVVGIKKDLLESSVEENKGEPMYDLSETTAIGDATKPKENSGDIMRWGGGCIIQ